MTSKKKLEDTAEQAHEDDAAEAAKKDAKTGGRLVKPAKDAAGDEDDKAAKDAPATADDEKELARKEREKRRARAKLRRAAKRRLSKGAKIALVALGVAAMVLSVTAMGFSGIINASQSQESYHLTGGVAATVDGTNIKEDTITKQIMSTRTSLGYTNDKDWAQYLVNQGQTPESLRETTIQSYVNQLVVQKAINDYNITVSDDDVEKAWQDAAKSYGGEDKLTSTITALGYTEDTYKDQMRTSLAQQKLKEKVAPEKTPADADILTYLNENLATYNDARRSENLLIKVDSSASDADKEKAKQKAQEALDKINSGELSFEDAVSQYSEDTGSKDKQGDVGWDKLTSFVTEYQTALSALSKGQVSGIVETTYGYHIIKCTDYWHVDGQVASIDDVPSEIKDYVSNVVKTSNANSDYTKWLEDYTKKANVKINDMPSDVPYNVSLDGVSKSTSSATTAGGTGLASTTTDSGSSDAGSSSADSGSADNAAE